MHIIVGDEDFGEDRSAVVPLLNVVNPGTGFYLDSLKGIQFPDKITVVVGQQKFSFDSNQGIPKPDVIFFSETVLADIAVVPFRFEVRGVAIKETDRPVILPDQMDTVLVFDYDLCKASVCLLDKGKVGTDIVGLAAIACKPRGVAVADDLIKPCRPLYVACGAVAGEDAPHQLKVFPGVEYK